MKGTQAGCVALLALALGACATGKAKYQCPVPNGVSCKSVKQMYDITDAGGEQGLADAKAALQGKARPPHGSYVVPTNESVRALPTSAGYVAPTNYSSTGAPPTQSAGVIEPTDPLPLRMPPRVLRVLITPWEDNAGDLHAGGYVFTEIEARRWTLASTGPAQNSLIVHPLQVEIAGIERGPARANNTAVPGANPATPGRESTSSSNARPSERSSDGGGS